jgi:hypothetical protein
MDTWAAELAAPAEPARHGSENDARPANPADITRFAAVASLQ